MTPAATAGAADTTAPVVTATVSPTSAWTTSEGVTIAFSATDTESDVAAIEYAHTGTTVWTHYTAPITVSSEGRTTFQFRATDAAGNRSKVKNISARIDRTAPVTTADYLPGGWVNRMVGVGLLATDPLSGMSGGAAKTQYSIDNGATWATGNSAIAKGEGVIRVLFRSTDAAGNVEAVKSVKVRIDSNPPVTRAYAARARKGRKAKLSYRVADPRPGCGRVSVTVAILKRGKRVETLRVSGTQKANSKRVLPWRCTLRRGVYQVKVYATDIAGNPARKLIAAPLTVR